MNEDASDGAVILPPRKRRRLQPEELLASGSGYDKQATSDITGTVEPKHEVSADASDGDVIWQPPRKKLRGADATDDAVMEPVEADTTIANNNDDVDDDPFADDSCIRLYAEACSVSCVLA